MDVHDLCDKETRKDQAVTDLLHKNTSRSERRRSYVRTTVVVYYNTDDDVDDCGDSLADQD